MMVLFLFGYLLKYIEKYYNKTKNIEKLENDYFKMIASYVIYVHLFNTFCCVRMEPTWNKKIRNLYVYNFKNINGP